ncbi:MAG: flotillin family protein, partial [Cyanobacteria bacterium P01_G01_bin.49]
QAEGKKQLALSWKMAGKDAKEIFLFQKIEPLIKLIAESVPELDIENVTIIEGNQGNTVPKMVSLIEQLKQTTGVDVAKIMGKLEGDKPTDNKPSYSVKIPPQTDIV